MIIQLDCQKPAVCDSSTGVRVSLVAEFGSFRYDMNDIEFTNNPKLRIYNSNFVDKIFEKADK